MNVTQYTFQSPYSSQIQIGKPILNSSQEPTTQAGEADTKQLTDSANSSLNNAQSFKASQTTEVTAKVESTQLLDMYA